MQTMFDLRSSDVLLVIDMQLDFLPGGALEVQGGDEIIPGINALASQFDHVILTQDWHPQGHISFASTHHKQPYTSTVEASYGTQHLWPTHSVQGTAGAEIHPSLQIPHVELILRKGFRRSIDSYSAFFENDGSTPTGLTGYLRERELVRLFFVGLAYDFCVGFSAVNAAQLGFESIVIEDLTRAVSIQGSVDRTNAAFAANAVQRIQSSDLPMS